MQKARRHPIRGSDRLWACGFRFSFTPLFTVLFTFPSRYSSLSVSVEVFSLAGWYRQIRTGFLWSRPTQDPNPGTRLACTRLSRPLAGFSTPFQLSACPFCWSYNPAVAVTTAVWALPLSLATTRGITCLFSFPPPT